MESCPGSAGEQLQRQIERCEATKERTGSLPIEDQADLRQALAGLDDGDATFRLRIEAILNPRGAKTIALSDNALHKEFYVTTRDNYSIRDADFADLHALYDSNHGYYVARRISLLRPKSPS